jgi:hypothetical protein
MRMPCWLVLAAVLVVGGCSESPPQPPASQQSPAGSATKVVYEIRPPMS